MNFLQPLFLAGLLAAALPIIIHLINRRKAVRRPFPAMKLLQESNERIARSVKIRQWVLLALRVLAVAVLAMAIAKPYVLSSQGMTADERLPTAVVLVVENGVAMDYGNWQREARRTAGRRLATFRPWDEVALLTTADEAPLVGRLTSDHGEVRRALDGIERRYSPGDLASALLAADQLLASSQLPNQRIVVIGSNTLSSLPDTRRELNLTSPIEYVSVGVEDQAAENLAVTSVTYQQEGSSRENRWRIDAVIENFGDTDATGVRVQLSLDGQALGGTTLEVPARGSASYSFVQRLEGTEMINAEVALIDADPLEADNRYQFLLRPQRQVRALLVNGSPSSNPINDELFFLTRAIAPGAEQSGDQLLPSITTPEGLNRRDLQDFDVVVLSNVATITAAQSEEFHRFVHGGGGLFITMGDQVETESYNQHLGELLPRPLRGVKQLARRDDPDAPVKVTRMGHPQRQHPIFQVFSLPGGSTLQSVQVYSYMLLDPAPADRDSRQLLAFQDNAPALLERQVGQGRVLLFTTSIDRDWTDFPVRSSYLPVVNRSLLYLARRATSASDEVRHVGTPIRINVSEDVRNRAILRTPQGERFVLEPVEGEITFTPRTPEVYTFFADQDSGSNAQPLENLTFAANIAPRASNLSPIPETLLQGWQSLPESSERAGGTAPGDERRVNLWSYLLFLVTMFLLVETVLGSRRSVLVQTTEKLRFWR